jgi:hypothetical protein
VAAATGGESPARADFVVEVGGRLKRTLIILPLEDRYHITVAHRHRPEAVETSTLYVPPHLVGRGSGPCGAHLRR